MGVTYLFRDLKHLLGAADISKAGERIAGLASTDEVEREARAEIIILTHTCATVRYAAAGKPRADRCHYAGELRY